MNLSAAFEGASQGLDQLASLQAQKEMQQTTAMRAENLAVRPATTTPAPTTERPARWP
jgi:hypothetical protein